MTAERAGVRAGAGPEGPAPVPDRRRLASHRLLTALAVLGFLAPVALYLWLIHHYALNIIRADQWNDVQILGDYFSGHLNLSALWALHYENRIFFPNLVVLLIGTTTHFNILVEEYASALLLILSTGLIVIAHRRRTGPIPLVWYVPVAVIMLCVVQHQNTLWGFQFAWYLVLFALAVTLAVLDRPELTWWFLGLAVAAAVVASFSSLQGLLVWPVGLLLLYLRRRRAAYLALWAAAAVIATALYFHNYVAPAGQNGYVFSHPGASIQFFLMLVGDIVGVGVDQTNGIGISVIVLGLILVLASIGVLVAYCRRDETGGSPLAFALICFGLLFAGLVTAGRIMLGLGGASQSAIGRSSC